MCEAVANAIMHLLNLHRSASYSFTFCKNPTSFLAWHFGVPAAPPGWPVQLLSKVPLPTNSLLN